MLCNHYVYTLTDPNDQTVRYVGQGVGRRFADHFKAVPEWEFKYGVYPWLWSLKKNGQLPLVNIIIKGLSKAEVNAWEIGLIDFLGRVCKGTGLLLNLADGGSGTSGVVRNAEFRRKIANAQKGNTNRKGKRHSEATKLRIGAANKGRKHSEYTKRIIKDVSTGRTHSENTKRKIANALIGNTNCKDRPYSETTRNKISTANYRRHFMRRYWHPTLLFGKRY